MQSFLELYSKQQIEVIDAFWDTIRWTRSTGKISDGIKKKELEFWSKYPPDLVIKALRTHIDKYPNTKEHYTRGIIRNLSKGQSVQTVARSRSGKPSIPIVEKSPEGQSVSEEEYAELLRLAERMRDNKRR